MANSLLVVAHSFPFFEQLFEFSGHLFKYEVYCSIGEFGFLLFSSFCYFEVLRLKLLFIFLRDFIIIAELINRIKWGISLKLHVTVVIVRHEWLHDLLRIFNGILQDIVISWYKIWKHLILSLYVYLFVVALFQPY